MQASFKYLLVLGVCFAVSGCQTFTTTAQLTFSKLPFVPEKNYPIMDMVCLWEPADGVGLDDLPTRGFAGQLMFFNGRDSEPIPVKGTVKIFLFDNVGTPEEQKKPIHRFEFDEGSFQAFVTETNLGKAYQIFIPYTRKSIYKTSCSIQVQIVPENGRPIFSKMATVTLPGPDRPQPKQELAKAESVHPLEQVAPVSSPTDDVSSAEKAAEYFRSASVPKARETVRPNNDLSRLRTAMSKAVEGTDE